MNQQANHKIIILKILPIFWKLIEIERIIIIIAEQDLTSDCNLMYQKAKVIYN